MNIPSAPDNKTPRWRRWRPRFGIKTIMLVTLLVAVLSATLSGLLGVARSETPSSFNRVFFVFLAAGAPMLVMIFLSVWPYVRRLIDHFNDTGE